MSGIPTQLLIHCEKSITPEVLLSIRHPQNARVGSQRLTIVDEAAVVVEDLKRGRVEENPTRNLLAKKNHVLVRRAPNGARLSCGALKKDSFPNLRAPPASSAC